MKNTAYTITLFGKVQGVGMRKSLESFANQLGLFGWVRNEKNGSVLIHIQGAEGPVTNFVNFCKQGSGLSSVDVTEVQESTFDPSLTAFLIR